MKMIQGDKDSVTSGVNDQKSVMDLIKSARQGTNTAEVI